MKEFFLVATPGLESLVAAEFKLWFPELEAKPENGGVTILAPIETGLSFNFVLKTPARILVRIGSFTCRDFPKLYQKLFAFPWHEWLDPRAALDAHATVTKSRMKIKSRIESTAIDAWKAWQDKRKSGKSKNPPPATLYLRVNDNVVTLSLDTSGELLHKRGARTKIGLAPLRENLAASLLMLLETHAADHAVELFDPMMGSGVFLLEAHQRDQTIETREFARAFRAKPAEVPDAPAVRPRFTKLVGFELDAKTRAAAKSNLGESESEIHAADIFQAEPLAEKPRWLVTNPPYGERLKIEGSPDDYYGKLFAACARVADPELACFLLPRQARPKLPRGWKVLEKRAFSNGGIPVAALVIGRKKE